MKKLNIPITPAMTNADRIRAMSDDELAAFIEGAENLGYCDDSAAPRDMTVLEWLQRPIQKGEK